MKAKLTKGGKRTIRDGGPRRSEGWTVETNLIGGLSLNLFELRILLLGWYAHLTASSGRNHATAIMAHISTRGCGG
jgi:hypothetical protein